MNLIPCAYCGGDVEFHKHEDGSKCHIIVCLECQAYTDLSLSVDPQEILTTIEEAQEKIAVHWNRRCPEVAEHARERILQGIADDIKKKYFPGLANG